MWKSMRPKWVSGAVNDLLKPKIIFEIDLDLE